MEKGRRLTPRGPFPLPLLGSNQDSPDPESGVLPVTPRATVTTTYTVGPFGLWEPNTQSAVRRARLPTVPSPPSPQPCQPLRATAHRARHTPVSIPPAKLISPFGFR